MAGVVDYLLDGLEAELLLERELGVKTVELDRTLLEVKPVVRTAPPPTEPPPPAEPPAPVKPPPAARPPAEKSAPVVAPVKADGATYDFVFLHDRPLSPQGVEMVAKIITAMGKDASTAPVIIVPPLPRARVYVILGGLAMRKFFPALRGEPGQWLKTESGEDVLVTYSPEYILRFAASPAFLKKTKQAMWTSLKMVMQRVKG